MHRHMLHRRCCVLHFSGLPVMSLKSTELLHYLATPSMIHPEQTFPKSEKAFDRDQISRNDATQF
jgi:hypothetical protein